MSQQHNPVGGAYILQVALSAMCIGMEVQNMCSVGLIQLLECSYDFMFENFLENLPWFTTLSAKRGCHLQISKNGHFQILTTSNIEKKSWSGRYVIFMFKFDLEHCIDAPWRRIGMKKCLHPKLMGFTNTTKK